MEFYELTNDEILERLTDELLLRREMLKAAVEQYQEDTRSMMNRNQMHRRSFELAAVEHAMEAVGIDLEELT